MFTLDEMTEFLNDIGYETIEVEIKRHQSDRGDIWWQPEGVMVVCQHYGGEPMLTKKQIDKLETKDQHVKEVFNKLYKQFLLKEMTHFYNKGLDE